MALLVTAACSTGGGAAGGAPASTVAPPRGSTGAPGSTGSTGSPGSAPTNPATGGADLLARIADEGDRAVLTRRWVGTLPAAEGATTPAIVVGTTDDGRAVAYVCDGTDGNWLTGTAAGGRLDLQGTGIGATAAGTIADDRATVEVAGTPVGVGRTDLAPAGDDVTLVRLTAPIAGGDATLTGGVILRGDMALGSARIVAAPVAAGAPSASSTWSTTTTTPRPATAVADVVVTRAGTSVLTVDLTAIARQQEACQSRAIALQTLVASLQDQIDRVRAQIDQARRDVDVFTANLRATPDTPQMAGTRAYWQGQIAATQARIQGLAATLTDLRLLLASAWADLDAARAGRC